MWKFPIATLLLTIVPLFTSNYKPVMEKSDTTAVTTQLQRNLKKNSNATATQLQKNRKKDSTPATQQNKNQKKTATIAPAQQKRDLKTKNIDIHEKYYYDRNNPQSPSFTLEISIPVIEMENAEVGKRIQKTITKAVANSGWGNHSDSDLLAVAINDIKKYAKNYFNNFDDISDYKNVEYNLYIKATASIGYNGYINYVINSGEYTGGTGIYGTYAINISPVTGYEIKFDNVFKSGSKTELTRIIEEATAKQSGVSSFQELVDNGIVWCKDMPVSENFILGKDTTTFLYGIYEIAARAMGEFHIKVPNSRIKHLMKL